MAKQTVNMFLSAETRAILAIAHIGDRASVTLILRTTKKSACGTRLIKIPLDGF